MEHSAHDRGMEYAALMTVPDDPTRRISPAMTAVYNADQEDIRESIDGDGDSYARLVNRHQDRVAARMWKFTRDATDHGELVQEVFVQAYFSLKGYRAEAPFEHWLARIATRVGYKFWKTAARERSIQSLPLEDFENLIATDPNVMDPENAAEMLHKLLDRLPPRDRLVLSLRYVEECSVEETAQLTGWTQSMVKVQAWRARKKLRKLLEEAGLEVER
jgi:RNA polymerase sigma-70 factor (ECF subfamily)